MQDRPLASRVRRLALRGSVAVVTASGLVLGVSPSAHAATQDVVCSGGGTITIDKQADGYHWLMSGVGQCTNQKIAQVRQVTLVGKAVTSNLGLCSGDLFLEPFNMSVAATFVQVVPLRGAVTTIQAQFWQIPATTFPIVSPFGITDVGGNTLGLGEFETHIFAQCPPDGQPTMQVNWTQAA